VLLLLLCKVGTEPSFPDVRTNSCPYIHLEGTSGGHLVQPPCSSRIAHSRLPRITSRWILSISKNGDSTAPLSHLYQRSATLTVKVFLEVSVCAHCLWSGHWAPRKRAWLCPLCTLHAGIHAHWWDPEPSLLGNSPSSQPFLMGEKLQMLQRDAMLFLLEYYSEKKV